MGGPIWSAPIHDTEFLDLLMDTIQNQSLRELGTYTRIIGMLSVIQEELHDVPLYYAIEKMCSILKLEMIPVLKFRLVSEFTVFYFNKIMSLLQVSPFARKLQSIIFTCL